MLTIRPAQGPGRPHLRRARSPWLALLAVPLLASACISVTQQGEVDATPTPSPTPSAVPTIASLPPTSPPTPSPTPAPARTPLQGEVVGFLPSWQLESAAKALDPDVLTTVVFHGVEANGDGRLVSRKPGGDVPDGWAALDSDAFLDIKGDLQSAGVNVLISVQRFGWTPETLQRGATLLESRKARRALADRIADFVEERGFDGVNLDVEPVPDGMAGQYAAFVREVRAALDEVDPELLLTVDVVASLTGYDLEALTADDAADFAILMGYDYRGAGAAVAGSGDPLSDPDIFSDLERTVAGALALAPAERLVLALPWYGRSWATASDGAGAATVSGAGIDESATPSYAEALAIATEHGREYDAAQASAWTAYAVQQCATCPATWRQAWYDDPDAFGAKVDLAVDEGLGGVGIWALGDEDGSDDLWWVLRDRRQPGSDRAAPNGTASLDPDSVRGDLEGQTMIEGAAELQLFAKDDDSGLFLVRVGLRDRVDADGQLVVGRSYPATESLTFPLGDESTGGSTEPGPRAIHVQWRDLAGNWSTPLVIDAYVMEPLGTTTPEDLTGSAS